MDKLQLERANSEVDLGVTVDSGLDFDQHINQKVNKIKATSNLAVIRRSYQFLKEQTFLPLYKSLVRSHLEYVVPVWGPCKIKHIELLENVQRAATKQLPGYNSFSYEDRLRKVANFIISQN